MSYLVIGKWRADKSVQKYNITLLEDDAKALVETLKSKGYVDAFYVLHPGGGHRYWTVGDDNQSVVYDSASDTADKTAVIDKYKNTYRDKRLYEGIIYNSVSVGTDDLTQQRLMSARILAKENSAYTVNWKTNDGFVLLDSPTIIALADAVRDHVQKCFDAHKAIDSKTYSTNEEVETAFDAQYSA